MKGDMTKGSPFKLIIRFLIPLLIGNTFQQLYNMADTVIVGNFVNKEALGAVGSTGNVMFLVIGTCLGLTNGFAVFTSQCFGAGDIKGCRKSVANGMLLSLIIAVIMTTSSLLAVDPILRLMNTPENLFPYAHDYLSVIFMGITCSIAYNLFSAFLRSAGDSVVPLFFLIFSAVLNIALDLLFIIVFRLGVKGAAIATDISQAISAILCWLYITKKVPALTPGKGDYRIDRRITRNQLHIGIPMSINFGITASGAMVMQSAINLFGDVAVEGFVAANKFHMLLTQGFMSMGQTMTTYTGQNYGCGDAERIKKGIKTSVAMMFVFSLAVGAAAVLLYPHIVPLFFDADADVEAMLPYAGTYLKICAVLYFPLACIFIFRNSIQGCNYALLPTCCGIMEFVGRAIVAYISMKMHSYNVAAACDGAAWVLAGLFGFFAWLYVSKQLTTKLKRSDKNEKVKN